MADLHYDAAQIAARFDKMIVLEGVIESGKTRTLNFLCAKLVSAGWTEIYSINNKNAYNLQKVQNASKLSDLGLVFEKEGKHIFVLTAGDKLWARDAREWYAFTYAMSDIFLRSHNELKDIKINMVICPCHSMNRKNSVKKEIIQHYSSLVIKWFETEKLPAESNWVHEKEILADKIMAKINEVI